MLRIALVTPMLPVAHDQTRGRYIHETARSLGRLATVRTFFQTMQYPRLPGLRPRSYLYGEVGADYTLDGCDVEHFRYSGVPVLSRGWNGHIASWSLTPRVRRFRPDLVLAYWVYPDGFAALRTARALGVPCVVGALGSDIHVRSGVNQTMTRRTIAGVDALLTVSEAMRQYTIREFDAAPERVHTIVNGFNTQVFRPMDGAAMRLKWGVGPREKLIVYVGRFVEAKGMRELVSAFATLAASDPDLSLALVGDGVMKDELTGLLESTGLRHRVHFPGGLPPEQVAEWINAADVLTLPSWSEGYPNVVVEGVACGRPVVATDVGGTREILNARNGVLIPPRDAAALADGLRRALDGVWDHGAIAAAMNRSWDDVAVETLAVCEQVARSAAGRRVA
ncbi:glycosyltransferase involved in cell wall biosynthesis [Sphaerotilus hippei]|uniref:Glycosyltransferase involved in cell wall biosynthesis n=1 Tax=Sphaerotilus hippei TaxID=744406 RepID=A0A318H0X1_9BURK|nr:glycosyltransferase [Sphaerotilus hippei]PXW96588.1 glycosyltransferase involved in cell wall biosynthesis [Sphaerotilus hippei]